MEKPSNNDCDTFMEQQQSPFIDGSEESLIRFADFIESVYSFLLKIDPSKELLEKIRNLLNDGQNIYSMVDLLYQDEVLNDLLENYCQEMFLNKDVIEKELGKDDSKARNYLGKCNDEFSDALVDEDNALDKVVLILGKGIRLAEDDKLLVELFLKRSKIFFETQNYHAAILDWLQILNILNSDSTTIRANDKLKFLNLMTKDSSAEDSGEDIGGLDESIKNILKLFEQTTIKAEKLIQDAKESKGITDFCKEEMENIFKQLQIVLKDFMIKKHDQTENGGPNQLSKKIGVKFFKENDKRSGFESLEPIEKDEMLFFEKPFIVHYTGSTNETHCANCFRRLIDSRLPLDESNDSKHSFVPCQTCSKFIFCDTICRDEAYESFHKQECVSKLVALEPVMGFGYMVVRIIAKYLKYIIKHIKSLDNDISEEFKKLQATGSSERTTHVGGSIEDNYNSLLKWLNHSDEYSTNIKLSYLLGAYALFHLFKQTKFLSATDFDPQDSTKFIKFLLYHMLQLSINAFTIWEKDPWINTKVSTGVGLYPNIVLLNHSCEPNVDTQFFGSKLLLKASNDIPINTEICTSYGPTVDDEYEKRQETLKSQYFFTCKCLACVEKRQYPDYAEAFLCQVCNGPATVERNQLGMKDLALICYKHGNEHKQFIMENIVTNGYEFNVQAQKYYTKALQTNFPAWFVKAISCFYEADKIFNETLYPLNSMYLRLKSQMVDCYQRMGHYDRASIYSKQIISLCKRSENPKLVVLSLEEKVRLTKIIKLWIEELAEEDNDKNKELIEKLSEERMKIINETNEWIKEKNILFLSTDLMEYFKKEFN